MHTFFISGQFDQFVDLPAEEARHAVQVLRLKAGDAVQMVDGKGGLYSGQIETAGKKGCRVIIDDYTRTKPERPYRITLAVAPTKNISRMEWLLEKATEIGVDQIIPIVTFHSERRKWRNDRLERIIVAAMKQSQRTWLPDLMAITSFTDFLQMDFGDSQRMMAYIHTDVKIEWKHMVMPEKNVIMAIGPEGGFSSKEAGMARAKGFEWCTLGPYRLRTETAALVALQAVHFVQIETDQQH